MIPNGAPIRFGLIGVDSTHSVAFTKLLGDGRTGAVQGGTIAAAWQGPTTADFPPSRDRNDELAAQVAQLGVPFLETPEEVARTVDALLVVASDARTHPGYLEQLCRFGKPIYIDTRFALTSAEAATMLEQAEEAGCLVLAGSPKRFAAEYLDAVQHAGARIERIELEGGLPEEPAPPLPRLVWGAPGGTCRGGVRPRVRLRSSRCRGGGAGVGRWPRGTPAGRAGMGPVHARHTAR